MGMIKEFREFISRGNVIDLAVGVIIGAAFNAIVKSLVDQVVMPPIGLATGGLDFSKLEWVLKPAAAATALMPAVEKVSIMYGAFINTIIQFLITAFAVFILVKVVNAARRAQADAPAEAAAPTPSETLLTEIRDLLKTAPPARAAAVAAPAVAKVVAPPAPKPAPKAVAPKAVVAKPAPKAAAPKAAAAKAPAKPAPKKAK